MSDLASIIARLEAATAETQRDALREAILWVSSRERDALLGDCNFAGWAERAEVAKRALKRRPCAVT